MDAGEDARTTAGREAGATNRRFHNYAVTVPGYGIHIP